jgi:tRNA(His) 5'-end guanylyltransferase
MKDTIGDRMKDFYEDRTRIKLVRRTNTILRVDGKSFHTYTRGLNRPFDSGLIEDMNNTAIHLCKNIQGAKLAYVQSDEISVLITDYDDINTSSWFDNNIQKMTSVSASLATAKFNQLRLERYVSDVESIGKFNMALFDSRVFQIPSEEEVINYFIWRQQDATRNSISSVAQSLYSHRELEGKNASMLQEMIFQKGINWNDYTPREKRGGAIVKNKREVGSVLRSVWETDNDTPIFSQDKDYIRELIPLY